MIMNPDGTFELERHDSAIPCPICKGYATRVRCTPEELRQYDCTVGHECCARAFVCQVRGHRVAMIAPAPEME